jgi:hypothetical protein
MKRLLLTVCVVLGVAAVAPAASAQMIQSGSIIMDLGDYVPGDNGDPVVGSSNTLGNPGFETGSLPPWVSSAWVVTGADAASGAYSAEDFGNFFVQQDITPVDVNDVLSISMYSKQPEGIAFQAVDFLYGGSDYDEFLVAPGVDWTFINMTGQLRAAGTLTGIRIWGYSGGGSEPDLTRCDDVVIEVEGATPVLEATWGRIKQIHAN